MIPSIVLILVSLIDDPSLSGMVALDFKQETLGEIVKKIGERGGNTVKLHFGGISDENTLKFTIVAAEKVPFWEAVDRLCEVASLQRQVNEGGGFGGKGWNVALYGPSEADKSPGMYSGPFRFGRFRLHANIDREFVRAQRAGDTETIGTHHAEFEVLAEPRVIALRTGPLEGLVAIDDRGESLLDPSLSDHESSSGSSSGYLFDSFPYAVKIQMTSPIPAGKTLKSLRGRMPVEVGILPKEPTLKIALASSVGKNFTTPDVQIAVREFSTKPDGSTRLSLTAKILGVRGDSAKTSKNLLRARSSALLRQIEIVDASGRAMNAAGGSASVGDEWQFDATYPAPLPGGAALPAHLLLYAPNWVPWTASFDFANLLLP